MLCQNRSDLCRAAQSDCLTVLFLHLRGGSSWFCVAYILCSLQTTTEITWTHAQCHLQSCVQHREWQKKTIFCPQPRNSYDLNSSEGSGMNIKMEDLAVCSTKEILGQFTCLCRQFLLRNAKDCITSLLLKISVKGKDGDWWRNEKRL